MAKFLLSIVLFALAASAALGSLSKVDYGLRYKASGNIFVGLANGGTGSVLNQAQASLSATATHAQKTTAVTKALVDFAQASQKETLDYLRNHHPSAQVQSFWINNQIYIRNASAALIQELANLSSVSRIQEEETTHIENFLLSRTESVRGRRVRGPGTLADWGLEKMRVPEVWAMDGGNTGEGLVVGNIDTGVRGSHELLRDKWVGLENNGWYDPEFKTPVSNDVYNHGTHTMGSLVGDDGIGAVPSARWLACKGYHDDGSGFASTFIACGQYMLCPVDYQGNNEDCSKAPHVVSNSWGMNSGELFDPILEAWSAAGILSSFSAGNLASCNSMYSPSDRPTALAVGATEPDDRLASFSSKGPSPSGQLKPEISAPGVSIYSASAVSDDAYMSASGTSMSCPLTTGVLALMKTFDPNLVQTKAFEALTQTAVRNVGTGASCGGVSDNVFPNNHIGYGRIDAYDAIQRLRSTQ